jgi:hypothetical protein
MIDLVDPKRTAAWRLAVSKGIESGSKNHILPYAALHSLGETVLRVPSAHRESRSPLFKQRCESSSIVIGVDQARSNRVSQDFRVVIDGLVERSHDRGNFDGPTSLGLFHQPPPEGRSHLTA